MRAAAEHLSGVTLELGGKSPAIVDAHCDLDAAADRIAWGKLINAGQTCVAPDYVLAHESVVDAFVERTVRAVQRFYGESEDDRARSESYCRLIDEGAFDRVTGALDATVTAGARIVIGGGRDRAGRYLAPTILTGRDRRRADHGRGDLRAGAARADVSHPRRGAGADQRPPEAARALRVQQRRPNGRDGPGAHVGRRQRRQQHRHPPRQSRPAVRRHRPERRRQLPRAVMASAPSRTSAPC